MLLGRGDRVLVLAHRKRVNKAQIMKMMTAPTLRIVAATVVIIILIMEDLAVLCFPLRLPRILVVVVLVVVAMARVVPTSRAQGVMVA
jgi:hypothetical protein